VLSLRAPDVAWRIESVTLCMIAVLSSLLVSYARARAEGLGIECKVGLVQRAERLLAISVPSILVGAGPRAIVLQVFVAVLALFSTITVVSARVRLSRNPRGKDLIAWPRRCPGTTVVRTILHESSACSVVSAR
jgi:phosphatidylglycerophosphate synthase